MDKNKNNRTDLLAAGRKKLQQFRQKKDGKAGKPSGKSSKPGRDGGDGSDASTTTAEKVLDGEVSVSNAADVDTSSELHAQKDSVIIDKGVGAVDQSSEDNSGKTISEVIVEKLHLEDRGRGEEQGDDAKISVPFEGGGIGGGSEDVELGNSRSSDIVISQEESTPSDIPVLVDLSSKVERDGEEQVTDVGAMQESGSSGLKQIDANSDIGIERVDPDVGDTEDIKEAIKEAHQSDLQSDVAYPPLAESKQSVVASKQVQDEQIDDAFVLSSEGAQVGISDKQDGAEGSVGSKDDSFAKSFRSNVLKLPSGSNACSIGLSELAEVIKGLDEDDFRFLFSSRLPFIEKNSLDLHAPEFFNFLERLKEQLYLMSLARDATQLQLSEQLALEMQLTEQFQKLVDEISVSNASLCEVQQKNEILFEELKQCRSELWEVSSGRDELQQHLYGSKAEVEEFSAKVDDLQNKLEISGGNLASLESDLADCRTLVAALQVENENLNGQLSLITEDKVKLLEDKEYCSLENDKLVAELAQCKALLASLELENVNLSEYIASLKEENRKFDQEKECLVVENGKLLSDLADCKALAEALQAENINLNELLTATEGEMKKLEEAQKYFVQENEKLALDIVNSRVLVDALQMEMSNMNGSLASLMEEKNKIEQEKQYLLSENQSGSCELADSKVVVARLQTEFSKAMRDLKEASLHIEQLTQENVLLRTNLELHIAQISSPEDTRQVKDFGGQNVANNEDESLVLRNEESKIAVSALGRTSHERPADELLPGRSVVNDSNNSPGSEGWKMHLKEVNEILQKLENAVEYMHSLSASSSRSMSKHVDFGVSKLIQAFETKSHTDDYGLAEVPSSESLTTVDAYVQAKEHIDNMQVVLQQMLWHAEGAYKSFEVEKKSRLSTELLNVELKSCCETLKSHSNHLEEQNIGLVVLCEALKQHSYNCGASFGDLVLLYKTLQKQGDALNAENIQHKERLRNFEAKITEFQSHLDEIKQSSNQMVSSVSDQVETLQKEVDDVGSLLNEEWNCFIAQIIQEVGKLDMSIEASNQQKDPDLRSRIAASVDAATKVIEGLQEHLKATQRDHQAIFSTYTDLNMEFSNLQTKHEMVIDILNKIYRNLQRLAESSGQAARAQSEKLVDPLDPGVFYDLLGQLENIFEERFQLESVNNKLKSDLIDQVREIDELKKRCIDLDSILKLFENVEEEFMLGGFKINIVDPVSGVESFINMLLQKYKEGKEQVSLHKEKPAVSEMQLSYFQKELDHLSSLLVQYENENLVVKESWKAVMEDITTLQAEQRERLAELEQSEQRISSLREKLGIAVSKGKGLILQRDSLKQSLSETSNQLEKCSQDLQLKEARIHELETKLQNYSEAGERMEALKSELAYIRNSATALRESFLLKDSVLQRIEEILEDLELPEHFHSRDIIEKVDWLAKSITGNMPLTDWDQKSSVGGGSNPESGFTGTDGWKEETQTNQDLADDLRRRYEELQSKFYGLAEHNELLEQSLIERNKLVQRWEEILAKIELPLQLKSLEPEDRIRWLAGALSDAQNHCNSLQQRIDYLDALSGSLTGDLEESQSRISELESAYHSLIVEKEYLLKNLETYTNNYDTVSKKASELEIENSNLLKEVTSLQEQLDQKLVCEKQFYHVEAELRRRYEELQSKFYGLTEHNELLERSLIERNKLVQRWEEILAKIELPLQLKSLEPEDRIRWLAGALSDAQNHCNSLQQRIDYLDALSGSITGDLEESQSRISELESAYHSLIVEKEYLLKNLETFTNNYDTVSKKASELEIENANLLKEVTSLQEQLDQKLVREKQFYHVEAELKRLQDLILDVLQDSVADDSEFASENFGYLEQLLRKLIEKYSTLLASNVDVTDMHVNEKASFTHDEERTTDSVHAKEDVAALHKKLEDTLGELMYLKEERERWSENNQGLVCEVKALDTKTKELQELLNHEENKSASLREKLNIAVKKGKSLVQQRDNMKQTIDELNAEVERLKSEVILRENSIAEYENRITNLSISQEKVQVVEAECMVLKDRLANNEHCLQEKDYMLSLIAECLNDIEVDFDLGPGNLVQKIETIGKHCLDSRAALDSSMQESRKSKRAAELLLAELNEVQERNDALQDELAKVTSELSELSRKKELSEASKSETLAQLEKLFTARSEERDYLLAEVSMLRSSIDQIREEISAFDSLLAGVLSEDLQILHNLDVNIRSCLEMINAPGINAMPAVDSFAGIISPKSENKVFMTEIGSIKEQLQRHSNSLREEASHIVQVMRGLYTEVASLKESFGSKERDLAQIKSVLKDKDSELFITRRSISVLYEACTVSIWDIEKWISQQNGVNFSSEAPWKSLSFFAGSASTEESNTPSEEVIMTVREKLLLLVKELVSRQNDILEDSQKEMKTDISNLQKELHEKDIQRERICAELVAQIKEAEVVAKNYLQELQSAKAQAKDFQSQVTVMEEEHTMLEKRVKELEDRETIFVDLQQRVVSLTDALAAKDQEIEALMQALDEEESQMEGLSNKILGLENDLQKKNQDLDNLEASRGKTLKKLSVTVSKFDELHHLSETLLSEVEKLQSQLQERDGEISFLRQEVTRCTDEALTATQMNNKRNSDEVHELLTWLDAIVSRVQVHDVHSGDAATNVVGEHKELLQKQIASIVSELEELRTVAQNKDLLLKVERSRVEELIRKEEFLQNSLLEKESQLAMLRRVDDSGQATSPNSEIVEVEPLINKRAAPGSIVTQVRGGRKTNNDQVAIAIDVDPTSGIEDEDDDKAHGFKSLTASRIVPRFTRPVSDMIDGLWMTCDRTLMRQPTLRLGIIIYWAILHALLAAFVV